ncbi:MAG: hypothetical protein V7647_1263 [Acidobacteriota bacterium]|jgi:hypothetical protein
MNLPRFKALVPKVQLVHSAIADLCALAGAGLVTVGIREVYRPAGFVFAGLALLAFSIAMSRRKTT